MKLFNSINNWLRKRRTLKIVRGDNRGDITISKKKFDRLSKKKKEKINSLSAQDLLKIKEDNLITIIKGLPKKCQFKNFSSKIGLMRYRCPYCKKHYCEEHRLPENHKCKNPKLPHHMKKGFGVKMLSEYSYGSNNKQERQFR